jgi:hypothetical protein
MAAQVGLKVVLDTTDKERARVAAAFGKENPLGLSYSVSGSWVYFGEGKMDQTRQGERFKGEFDTNYLIFIAASVNYKF